MNPSFIQLVQVNFASASAYFFPQFSQADLIQIFSGRDNKKGITWQAQPDVLSRSTIPDMAIDQEEHSPSRGEYLVQFRKYFWQRLIPLSPGSHDVVFEPCGGPDVRVMFYHARPLVIRSSHVAPGVRGAVPR